MVSVAIYKFYILVQCNLSIVSFMLLALDQSVFSCDTVRQRNSRQEHRPFLGGKDEFSGLLWERTQNSTDCC
jgi:hypothetical protein